MTVEAAAAEVLCLLAGCVVGELHGHGCGGCGGEEGVGLEGVGGEAELGGHDEGGVLELDLCGVLEGGIVDGEELVEIVANDGVGCATVGVLLVVLPLSVVGGVVDVEVVIVDVSEEGGLLVVEDVVEEELLRVEA